MIKFKLVLIHFMHFFVKKYNNIMYRRCIIMHKGTVPIAAGTVVLVGGCVLKHKLPLLGAGLIGYGLAHIVLGGADYVDGAVVGFTRDLACAFDEHSAKTVVLG